MKPNLLLALLLASFCSCQSNAQKKTAPNAVKAAPSGASEIIQTIPSKTCAGLKPGDMAPDVVKIDVDRIITMINGACIVEKGDVQALMDLQGHLITPWGKYKYLDSYSDVPYTALLRVHNPQNDLEGFINSKGQVVVPIIYKNVAPLDYYKRTKVGTQDYKEKIINSKGATVPEFPGNYDGTVFLYGRPFYNQPVDGRLVKFTKGNMVRKGNTTTGYAPTAGYATPSGQVVIPNKYVRGAEFSEGLAAVAQLDQFGILKWGFINSSGAQVIPFNYQVQPGNFHEGLALVKPVGKTDFDFAYIDKQGNIKLKIGKGDGYPPNIPAGMRRNTLSNFPQPSDENYRIYEMSGYFIKDYSFWGRNDYEFVLMDKSGNFHGLADFIKDSAIAHDKRGLWLKNYNDLGINFRFNGPTGLGNINGMVDYDGNILVPPVFNDFVPDYYSSYAIASVKLDYQGKYTGGVINRQGVFVMVIGEKSKF